MLIRAPRNTQPAHGRCCGSSRKRGKKISNKRASSRGALFVCLLFCWAVIGAPAVAAQGGPGDCAAGTVDERATVAQVIDGDTLRLRDGRSVRFIGINTPEIGRQGKPSEPLAEAARKTLQTLLGKNATVGLRFGRERQDRYGRVLAHVYLSGGKSVEAALLAAGLAAQIVVPPNVAMLACYRAVEARARRAAKGVWRGIYRPVPVNEVPRDARGFRIIRGRVVRVGESRRSLWLNFRPRSGEGLREGVAVRIAREDLRWFGGIQPQTLRGKTIIVRGWLSPYKKQLVMRLRHSASMEVMP